MLCLRLFPVVGFIWIEVPTFGLQCSFAGEGLPSILDLDLIMALIIAPQVLLFAIAFCGSSGARNAQDPFSKFQVDDGTSCCADGNFGLQTKHWAKNEFLASVVDFDAPLAASQHTNSAGLLNRSAPKSRSMEDMQEAAVQQPQWTKRES